MFFRKSYNPSEDELQSAIEQLKKGSAEAFHLLYEKYRQKVYRFCLRMLGDEAPAKDAFQETFIKVYEHRKEFRGKNFSSWLFTIARHNCLNILRTRKEYESFDSALDIPENNNDCDYGLKTQIEEAISMLPVPMREAFILREYEDCSYQEIADILSIDLSLAKVRVHRSRLILRKLLKPIRKELYES